jgi:hypothetical protein
MTLICSVIVCAVPLLASMALGANTMKSESGWFDFENCAFCKNLSADPGLLEHTTWETHAIKSGMMTIMTIEPEYDDAMAKAEKAMNDLGMKIQAGEVNPMGLKMCGHCQKWGMLMMGGKVKMEEVRGHAARVSLSTSDDPAVVAQLHEIAERNAEEQALMMSGGEKKDHPHDAH